MRCGYFETGQCRSCTRLDVPYARQLADKDAEVRAVLGDIVPRRVWRPIVGSLQRGFRNRVKLAVGGSVDHPRIGLVRPGGAVTDIRLCPIQDARITEVLPVLARFVARARLEPYDVAARRGELKYLLVSVSPDGEILVRFVMRSTESLARIRKHLPALLGAAPKIVAASVNLLPGHRAVTEGEEEIALTGGQLLPMRLPGATLYLTTQSFFQTNTRVAEQLYGRARELVDGWQLPPAAQIYDLYCGVGGFALHLAGPGRTVTGVEISAPAIAAARRAAAERPEGDGTVRFVSADAPRWLAQAPPADVVVVNPPRRGIGAELCAWLDAHGERVLYSSCNAVSLAADLARMPNLVPTDAGVFDMFAHTGHAETLVALERR